MPNLRRPIMAKQKSDILSGMGSGYEIVKTIIDEVKNRGGSDDDVRKILSDRTLQIRIGDLIMGTDQQDTTPRSTIYPVEIDYSDTFEQRLAAGRYDWKNSDITEKHFPVKGEGQIQVDLELAHYGKSLSTEAILAAIEAQGYRPATIEELLAFGATYPEFQREFPIVALDSVWQHRSGLRGVAYLRRHGGGRDLELGRLGLGWDGRYRFLVVRK